MLFFHGLLLLHKELNNSLWVDRFEICVGLSSSNKNDGLTSDVGHRNGWTHLKEREKNQNLIINSQICFKFIIEFGTVFLPMNAHRET